MRTHRIAFLASLLLVLGFRCSAEVSGPELDVPQVESEIQTGIEEQTDVAISGVDCPDDVPIDEGATFTCTATVEGSEETLSIRVTQTDSSGTVDWQVEN
jgi:hypothetical protein